MKIVNVVGARPNFMKIAPLMREYKKHPEIKAILVHTGQHYDFDMSDSFFKYLDLPHPDYNLGVGSASHSIQTAKIMIEFEKVCLTEKPDMVVVVGDVNSTLACSLVAAKLGIKVAHVEAGLRSFDMTMPEEVNRLVTDQISEFLFVTEQSGLDNLRKEGIDSKKVHFVGNIMIDSLVLELQKIEKSVIMDKLKIKEGDFFLLTMHRPGNVDSKENLETMLGLINEIQRKKRIVYPTHPRTMMNLEKFDLKKELAKMQNLISIPPLNYIDFINLVSNCTAVITDSGGIQEETTYLGVPCITLRENTERPITVTEGTNLVVGNNQRKVMEAVNMVLQKNWKKGRVPELWDGKTAERIVRVLLEANI